MSTRLALICRTCGTGLELPGVPVVADDEGDPVKIARRIGAHRPDLLLAVASFGFEHDGHEYAPCSIEPIEEYRKRS